MNEPETDYAKYRGKCKQFVDELCAADSTLKAVRGHYYDPHWGEQAHWWCVKPDGTIVDPTAMQFPSKGKGVYVPFDGIVVCAQCGREGQEDEFIFYGRYPFCSNACCMAFVM